MQRIGNTYQDFIHVSRYARWIESENRRETWGETVDRYMNFMQSRFKDTYTQEFYDKIHQSILGLEVLPSMRALMTAGAALERENVAGYNPVVGSTPVLTKEFGMIPISKLAGTSATVLNKDSRWADAEFKSYGVQEVYSVVVRGSNTQQRQTILCTANHRWLLEDGTVVPTIDLINGDRLPHASAPRPDVDNIDYRLGLVHGLIYGDGTSTYSQERLKGYHIRLCGDQDELLPVLKDHGKVCYPPSANGDPVVMLYGAFAKTHSLKSLPVDETPEYVIGFIRGWLAADGSVSKKHQITLCVDNDGLDWFDKYAPTVGVLRLGVSELPKTTNLGERSRSTFNIRLDPTSLLPEDFIIQRKRDNFKYFSRHFKVESVTREDYSEEVFCAEVDDTNTFVLSNGLVTGNCAFVAIDSPRAFDEALYILMNGTGVGFSVEDEFISQLPRVADEMYETETVIVVHDSKLGWAKAYKELIALLYMGQIPTWDVSRVRPKGARLKTFGGRASGPEPLVDLFRFTVEQFVKAKGRRLKPIEAHDIMCKVGEVVVVGGVRRSALISFSDLGDFDMAKAKSGQWWEDNPQRALANNTAVYRGKPGVAQFLREWRNLYESKSGERGLQNIEADRMHFEKMGRREYDSGIRGNPCLTYDSRLLTENGLQKIGDLAEAGENFMVCNGDGKFSEATPFFTGYKKTYTVTLSNGLNIDLTGNHLIEVIADNGDPVEMAVNDLEPGMKIMPFYSHEVWSGGEHVDHDTAIALGLMFGDGTVQKNGGKSVYIRTRESEVIEFLSDYFKEDFVALDNDLYRIVNGVSLAKEFGFSFEPLPERTLPEQIFGWSADSVRALLKGIWSANGSAMSNYNRIVLKATNRKTVNDLQILLSALGFNAYVTTNASAEIEWGNGAYVSKESYDLNVGSGHQYLKFQEEIGFLHNHKMVAPSGSTESYRPGLVSVKSVEYKAVEPVYDFTEPITHWGWANGMKVHNCNEVRLNSQQFCNLTEIVVSPDDDWEDLKRKAEIATVLGTWQSSLTNFKYLRKGWRDTTEKERLLGVSMTGIFGNPMLYRVSRDTEKMLDELRALTVEINKEHAEKIGVEPSVAITVVKPAGTTSQLTLTSSGIHPWHSQYYIRRVRGDNKDPLTQMLKDAGIPHEPDVMKPTDTTVFSFPIAAPSDAVTRHDLSAIEHLEVWKMFRNHWTEHNPSVTISVRENEWVDVAAWVYKNFDYIGGISFLPYSDHTYQQAPYEDITEEQYVELAKAMPKTIDWTALPFYEMEDGTTGSQELACSSGSCEVINIGSVTDI